MNQEKITKFGTYMEKESPTKLTGDKITRFIERLKKIGIDVKLSGNYPWVYIDEICGIKVTEKFEANHGFTLIVLPGRNDSPVSEFTDITETFNLIRKYTKEVKFRQTEKLKGQIEVLEYICDKTTRHDDSTKYFVLCKLSDLKLELKK
jgi:hypothetical protein